MNLTKYLFLFLLIFYTNFATAEIIENQKVVNKEFGSWVVSCKEDIMLDDNTCKFFTEIIEGTVLFVNPNNANNKLVLISREILDNTQAIFRVDKNELIESELTKKNAYNIVDINLDNKIKLLEQMKSGNVFYIRMNIKDSSSDIGSKQITAKLNLADFTKALIYYDSMAKKAI